MLRLSSSGLGAWLARRPCLSEEETVRKGWYDIGRFSGGSFFSAARLCRQYANMVIETATVKKAKMAKDTIAAVLHGLSIGVGIAEAVMTTVVADWVDSSVGVGAMMGDLE